MQKNVSMVALRQPLGRQSSGTHQAVNIVQTLQAENFTVVWEKIPGVATAFWIEHGKKGTKNLACWKLAIIIWIKVFKILRIHLVIKQVIVNNLKD